MGNAPELIIAIFALRESLYDVVRASITGSILGNTLFTLGFAMYLGGLRHQRQRFNPTAAGMNAQLLLLAAIGLIVPALFKLTTTRQENERDALFDTERASRSSIRDGSPPTER